MLGESHGSFLAKKRAVSRRDDCYCLRKKNTHTTGFHKNRKGKKIDSSQTEVEGTSVVLPSALNWTLFPSEPQRRPAAEFHKPASHSQLPRIVLIFPAGSRTVVATGPGGFLLLPISAACLRWLSSLLHFVQTGKERGIKVITSCSFLTGVTPPVKQRLSFEKLNATATATAHQRC